MRHRIRQALGRGTIRIAAHAIKLAERLLDRNHRPANPSHMASPNCPGCLERPVPGVLWPVQINGGKTRDWIGHCDECRRFTSNIQAAAELVRLGLINELGIARPAGSPTEVPFGTGTSKHTRK